MKRMLTGTMIAFALAAVVLAQSAVTGKWEGETSSGSRIVLDLTVTEMTLTGTFTRNDQSSAIADGKVSKNKLTFKAMIRDQKEGFTGELAGDQITIWQDSAPSKTVILKRVKN